MKTIKGNKKYVVLIDLLKSYTLLFSSSLVLITKGN